MIPITVYSPTSQRGSFDTFNQPDFTPAFETEFTDPALEEEANEICKGDQMCLFDIAATGRTEIGMDTLQQQEQIDEIMRIITTPGIHYRITFAKHISIIMFYNPCSYL